MNAYHYLFKFIVIGDTGVGKSCVVLRFIQNKIRQSHDVTIGVEFGAKTMSLGNQSVKLQIWDTAGQQNFRSITRSYYRSAIGALLVYDITRRETFDHIRSWVEEVRHNGNPYMEILLVGNKNDLQLKRNVSFLQGQQMAKRHNLSFIEINARDYEMVQETFRRIATSILHRVQQKIIPIDQGIGIKTGDYSSQKQINIAAKKKKKKCC